VTGGDEIAAAVMAVLPGNAAARMHGEAVWLAVLDRIPGARREEVTGALLRLTAQGRVIRWTRFARPGQGGIERWYRADSPAEGAVPPRAASLFD
jgi:hypothetical protein